MTNTDFKRNNILINTFLKETGVRLPPFYPNKTLNQQTVYSVIVPSSLINNSFDVFSAVKTLTR